jgi:hypothetical protein
VPGVFPGGKCGRCVRLPTLPPSCAVAKKSGNLNFLEPSGPIQACNGTALPLPFKSSQIYNIFRVHLPISFTPSTFVFLSPSLSNLFYVKVQQYLYRHITGPEGSRRLRFRDLKQIETWSCQPHAPASINPQEIFLVFIFVRG